MEEEGKGEDLGYELTLGLGSCSDPKLKGLFSRV